MKLIEKHVSLLIIKVANEIVAGIIKFKAEVIRDEKKQTKRKKSAFHFFIQTDQVLKGTERNLAEHHCERERKTEEQP